MSHLKLIKSPNILVYCDCGESYTEIPTDAVSFVDSHRFNCSACKKVVYYFAPKQGLKEVIFEKEKPLTKQELYDKRKEHNQNVLEALKLGRGRNVEEHPEKPAKKENKFKIVSRSEILKILGQEMEKLK